jgi:hypothetical protein
MKKFLVVLLSLGLIVAFGATASAADVKFSGSYYVVGWYADNQTLAGDKTSSAALWQRFRLQPVFQIAEGLTLTARWDAMEKGWGSTNWKGKFDDMNQSRGQTPAAGNPKIQENFEWERGYVTFKTAIGQFDVGYQSSGKWGTDFLDDEKSRPRIKFTTQMGPMVFIALFEKQFEAYYADNANPAFANQADKVDADNDNYAIAAIYNFTGGNTGFLYKYTDNRATRPALAGNYRSKLHYLSPYVKATFGPVYIESEIDWLFGKAAAFDSGTTADKDCDAWGAYLKARVNVGPAYVGGAAMWNSGDDGSDATKKKDWVNGSGNGSQDLDVGLILGNDSLQTWQQSSGNGGANGFAFDSAKYNSLIVSGFAGFDVTPKLNIESVLLWAQLDKKIKIAGQEIVSKDLGWELDITAKYKIYDNLTYMLGAGYLWAGDAFKGNNNANRVSNDYLLMNRISLNF